MTVRPATLAVLLAFAVGGPGSAAHAQQIRGRVLDAHSGAAVPTAEVVLLGPGGDPVAAAISGRDGDFRLLVPGAGVYQLHASRFGYFDGLASLELDGEDDMELEFRLQPAAVEMDSLAVTARAPRSRLDEVGFHGRSHGGTGFFLDRAAIDELGHRRTMADLLRDLPGVTVQQGEFGPAQVVLKRQGTPLDPRPICRPYLFLDGLPVQPPWEDLIRMEELLAVEVYPEPGQVPASFASRGQSCGVVVVWTRRRF